MLQPYGTEERPDPIAERVGLGMFTDREKDMDSLIEWVDMVGRKVGRSRALVSHRRYGKTAILERLYNRIFWERDDVMPFYFELHEGIQKIWVKDLAEMYFYTFIRQFLAYRTRDTELAFRDKGDQETLYTIAEKAGEQSIVEYIDWWKKSDNMSDHIKVRAVLQNLPHRVAVETGLSIIVMFDEFQRLNRVVFRDEACTRPYERYTDSYSTAAESSRAPMLISGSEVTVLTQEALWGAMLGRVHARHIKRLPLAGALELVFKFAFIHKLDVSLEVAYNICRQVDGHPYYIWALFNSEYDDKELTTEEGVEAALQHPEDEIRVEKIWEELELPISVEETNEILQKLIWCDLVIESGDRFYGGLSDPVLAQVLNIQYSWEIDEMTRREAIAKVQAQWQAKTIAYYEEIIDRMRSELNHWVGHVAEAFIQTFMRKHFDDQMVDGAKYFNLPNDVPCDILLTEFDRVYSTKVQAYGATRSYQIDIYALPKDEVQPPWVVEVKNWQKPVSLTQVEHFWNAAQSMAEDKGHEKIVCWFHARSGFTEPARKFLAEKGILNTDEPMLTQIR